MRTLTATVAGVQFKQQHLAVEEFWRRMEAANGGRPGDPRDYINLVNVEWDPGRGWVIEYEVPTEILEQNEVRVIREEPTVQNVLKPANLADAVPAQTVKPRPKCHVLSCMSQCVEGSSYCAEHQDKDARFKDTKQPTEIMPSLIQVTGHNPRKTFDPAQLEELKESIREHGIIEPLMVRPKGNSRYELVVGERRLRAARELGLEHVPVVVRQLTDAQMLDIMLAENLQRVDLNPIEEAHHLKRVLEVGKLTQTELGKRIGKSQEWVSQRLRLAEAPAALQDLIICRRINVSSAIEVLAWKDTDHYDKIMHEIGAWCVEGEELPRARVRQIIKEITEPGPKALSQNPETMVPISGTDDGTIDSANVPEASELPFVNPEDCKDCDIYDRETNTCPEGCTNAEECEYCFCERPEDEDEGEKQDLPQEPEPAAEAEKESDVPEENVPSEPTMLDGHRKLLAAAKEGADGVNQWKCNICGHGFTVKPERADNVARMLEHLCNRLMFDSPGQATGEHRDALRRVSRAIAEGGDTWGLLQKLFHQAGPEGP